MPRWLLILGAVALIAMIAGFMTFGPGSTYGEADHEGAQGDDS